MPIKVDSIHEKLKQALHERQLKELDDRAYKIEQVLKELKSKQQNAQGVGEISGKVIDSIREEATKALGFKSTKQLFNRAHKSASRSGADDIAEAELAAVIAAIQNEGFGTKGYTYQDFLGGRDPVTVYSKEIMRRLPDKCGDKIINDLKHQVKEGEKWRKRSQKTDVKGLVEIEGEVASEYKELIELFKNVTFSVKNYSSAAETTSIGLGTTDKRKAIRGALYHIGYRRNFNDAIKALSQDDEGHESHLIFAYELAGWGQGVGVGKNFVEIPNVDFLIYNDPAVPENISVKSTKRIIYDKAVGKNSHLTASQSISKSYFNMKKIDFERQLPKKNLTK